MRIVAAIIGLSTIVSVAPPWSGSIDLGLRTFPTFPEGEYYCSSWEFWVTTVVQGENWRNIHSRVSNCGVIRCRICKPFHIMLEMQPWNVRIQALESFSNARPLT